MGVHTAFFCCVLRFGGHHPRFGPSPISDAASFPSKIYGEAYDKFDTTPINSTYHCSLSCIEFSQLMRIALSATEEDSGTNKARAIIEISRPRFETQRNLQQSHHRVRPIYR